MTVISLMIGSVGCSSSTGTDKPWVIQYVGSSDNTWTAMQIVLIDLDYTVESENRNEGRIRATRVADEAKPASVLSIDQIARQDMVNLFIKVSAAPGEPELDPEQREALAQEFLEPVNELLFK
jgi:hypothetical protein